MTGAEIARICKPWVGVLAHLQGIKSAPQYPLALERACWEGARDTEVDDMVHEVSSQLESVLDELRGMAETLS